MFGSRHLLVGAVVGGMLASVAWAVPVIADEAIYVSTGRGTWDQDFYVPTLPYGSPVPASAGSSGGGVVAVTVAGNCTVETLEPIGLATQVNLTATATSGVCTVTAATSTASATYELPLALGNQTAALGEAFNPMGMLEPGKKYLMGSINLKTDQGNAVTFAVTAKKKYCKMVCSKKKVFLKTTKNSANKSCTVTATAPTNSPNYSPLDTVNTLGVFE